MDPHGLPVVMVGLGGCRDSQTGSPFASDSVVCESRLYGFTCHSAILPTRSLPFRSLRSDAEGVQIVLDETAKAIIEQLQEDGRRPYSTIAAAVGLSEAAVRQRVQRLIETGVMQIVAVTDPLTVGFHRQAMIGIRTTGDLTAVADALAAIPEVDYVVISAGSFDLLVEVVCEDDDHLLSLLNDKIRAISEVSATETFVYLRLRKQTYTWGAR